MRVDVRERNRLRDCANAFSRSAFTDVLSYDDYSFFNWLYSLYNFKCDTYLGLVKRVYSIIANSYRCEYVYKNELLARLLKKYGVRNTAYYSEFRVGDSIADMAMFNGESKAFEIKTEYDSPRRLDKQLANYRLFFDKCYLVIPESKLQEYLPEVDESTGIIVLGDSSGKITLNEVKDALPASDFDPATLLSCLRIPEYEHILSRLGFDVTPVPGYERYKFSSEVFANAPRTELKSLFLEEIKKRNNNTGFLKSYPMALRQMLLSLNLSESRSRLLIDKLNITINKT